MSLLIVILLGLAILTVVLAHLLQFAVEQYTARVEPTDIIMNVPLNDVYMKRWVIYPKIDTKKSKWDHRHKFAIIINRFYGPDLDPPHNHMGWHASIALDGIGVENVYDHHGVKIKTREIYPFDICFRRAHVKHTISGSFACPFTTLMLTRLDPNGVWGFWEGGTFIEAKNFKSTKAFKH